MSIGSRKGRLKKLTSREGGRNTHKVQTKGILSAHNGMNVYRGCLHGCIYCDARSKCYQIKHDFEDIEVKENAPQLLEEALKKKRKRCMIGTGSMCDPYIPLEKELLITRKCLEVIDYYGFGLAILTKSDLILRDLDLLKSIHNKSKCVVQITLTTCDTDLCRILEPNVCTTLERVRILKVMQEEGIPTQVWLCPILPYINDTQENVEGILKYCVDAGVHGIMCFNMGMTLREGDREYYYRKLDQYFPGMKEKYIHDFGNAYEISSPNDRELMKLFRDTCRKHHILYTPEQCFRYIQEYEEKGGFEQLSLF